MQDSKENLNEIELILIKDSQQNLHKVIDNTNLSSDKSAFNL